MPRVAVWTLALACACAGCGKSSPSVPTPSVRTIELVVSANAAVAIRHASLVSFSVSAQAAYAVYAIDFGDGQSGQMFLDATYAPGAWAHHRYESSGTFTSRVTILDVRDGSRLAAGSATCTVSDMNGVWSNTTVNSVTNRTETRSFQLRQTDGLLSGTYADSDGTLQTIAGEVGEARSIEITRDGRQIAYGRDKNYFESGGGIDTNVKASRFTSATAPW